MESDLNGCLHRCRYLLILPLAVSAFAQTELLPRGSTGGAVISTSDLAVLEAGEERTDLPCEVWGFKPQLGLDLGFHSGYQVRIPVQRLSGDRLRVLFRVEPAGEPERAHYFSDRVKIPQFSEDQKGSVTLSGIFDVGPGHYQVDWLARDRQERVCAARWEIETRSEDALRDLPTALKAGEAAAFPRDVFASRPRDRPGAGAQNLYVRILVNFTPPDPGASSLGPKVMPAIVAILRSIAREPAIGGFGVVAFNTVDQSVIYREENLSDIDFPALGKAVASLQMGRVDYHHLADPGSDMRFLGKLLYQEVTAKTPRADAVIVVGPKSDADQKIPDDVLESASGVPCPLFYLSYIADPSANPWRDAIAGALKMWKGFSYTIGRPVDLAKALRDMTLRLGREESATALP